MNKLILINFFLLTLIACGPVSTTKNIIQIDNTTEDKEDAFFKNVDEEFPDDNTQEGESVRDILTQYCQDQSFDFESIEDDLEDFNESMLLDEVSDRIEDLNISISLTEIFIKLRRAACLETPTSNPDPEETKSEEKYLNNSSADKSNVSNSLSWDQYYKEFKAFRDFNVKEFTNSNNFEYEYDKFNDLMTETCFSLIRHAYDLWERVKDVINNEDTSLGDQQKAAIAGDSEGLLLLLHMIQSKTGYPFLGNTEWYLSKKEFEIFKTKGYCSNGNNYHLSKFRLIDDPFYLALLEEIKKYNLPLYRVVCSARKEIEKLKNKVYSTPTSISMSNKICMPYSQFIRDFNHALKLAPSLSNNLKNGKDISITCFIIPPCILKESPVQESSWGQGFDTNELFGRTQSYAPLSCSRYNKYDEDFIYLQDDSKVILGDFPQYLSKLGYKKNQDYMVFPNQDFQEIKVDDIREACMKLSGGSPDDNRFMIIIDNRCIEDKPRYTHGAHSENVEGGKYWNIPSINAIRSGNWRFQNQKQNVLIWRSPVRFHFKSMQQCYFGDHQTQMIKQKEKLEQVKTDLIKKLGYNLDRSLFLHSIYDEHSQGCMIPRKEGPFVQNTKEGYPLYYLLGGITVIKEGNMSKSRLLIGDGHTHLVNVTTGNEFEYYKDAFYVKEDNIECINTDVLKYHDNGYGDKFIQHLQSYNNKK